MDVKWDIRHEGRAWTAGEFRSRVDLRPEKLEVWEGKLLFSEEERLALLGLLLENVGADAAVKLGDPKVWIRAALARPRPFLSDPFNRTMLALALLNPVVVVGVVWLARHLPPPTPILLAVFVSATVAFGVSLFVAAFLRD